MLEDSDSPPEGASRDLPVTDDTLGVAPGKRRVLVVDDYGPSADGLVEHLETWGFSARAAYSAEQALAAAEEFDPELVVSDLVMPGADGIQLLEKLRAQNLNVEFLMLTGQGTIETAKEAIQKGAFDYLTKPVDPPHLRHLLTLAAERLESRRTMFRLRRVLQNHGWYDELMGESPPMIELKRMIEQVAPSAASVMITGESGTGKELVARTLHRRSLRAAQPFIPINCAAIPENLLESELFGHERGAFTGAVATRQGCFELAHGGTVFLDEIGEMPALLQAKLLRALEERSFRRVGGSQEIHVDVRVIAATNRDLEEARRTGALREDLYYRLNVFHLHLAPLRDRGEDKLALAQLFVVFFAHREAKPVVGLDDATRYLIMRYAWPGNVRELRNAMERAVIVAGGEQIAPENLPTVVRGGPSGNDPVVLAGMTVDEVERRLIFLTLEKTEGNKTRAAKLLGVSLKTLHNKLRRYREEGLLAAPGAAAEFPSIAAESAPSPESEA
ncbi:MAG: sigma-54 dependent transcriptional regulator [Candidatus Eisenbacteria bacterium]